MSFRSWSVVSLTKLLLTAVTVKVDPEFAADVVLHTGIFLVVKSVQSSTDHGVHLRERETTTRCQL